MKSKKFVPGVSYVPVSGKVFGREEVQNAIKVAREGWWTEGKWGRLFEDEFKKYLGVKYVALVNSGSSANLLALASLTSDLFGYRKLKAGDEFITTAVSFPTTINPGIQYGLKPIFVDSEIDTLNIDIMQIEKAITKNTKLIMVAHTLGKPINMDKILELTRKYKLWLIEDCCDALGSRYRGQNLGTFGDVATYSFYPAHQITMGEGGAVITNNIQIDKSVRQFRDWGRDCWCGTGKDNTCGKRFTQQWGELPLGYDHKYVYSQVGYNLKLTDFQAAIGVAQLKRLPKFIDKRKKNYSELYKLFKNYENDFILMRENKNESVSYFGFPAVVSTKAKFSRNNFTEFLEDNKIGTRNVFAGNILKQPGYLKFKGNMVMINSDLIMNNAFWIGVYPGINGEMMKYVKNKIIEFMDKQALK